MHTVTAIRVASTDDGWGNTTETATPRIVRGVMFAPEGVAETQDPHAPKTIGRASLYGAFPKLDSDDQIRHGPGCCSGAEFEHGDWNVVGGSRGWGAGMVVVPIDKAG